MLSCDQNKQVGGKAEGGDTRMQVTPGVRLVSGVVVRTASHKGSEWGVGWMTE